MGAGGGTGAVAVGAVTDARVSVTRTTTDLGPLGTCLKASVVDLPSSPLVPPEVAQLQFGSLLP